MGMSSKTVSKSMESSSWWCDDCDMWGVWLHWSRSVGGVRGVWVHLSAWVGGVRGVWVYQSKWVGGVRGVWVYQSKWVGGVKVCGCTGLGV